MRVLVAHDMDEIIPGLYVGNQESARNFLGEIICVLEPPYCRADELAHHVPLLFRGKIPRTKLDLVAGKINGFLRKDRVLVHCAQGVERSPLAVVWFLHSRRGMQLDDAYAYVMAKHPPTQNRLSWID